MDRVLEFLERHEPHIVCLQETKTASEGFPHLELQAAGYTAVDHSGGQWAGVAVLARGSLDIGEVSTQLVGSPLPEDARWVEAQVDGIRVVSVYVINGRTPHDPMFEAKLHYLQAMRERAAELLAQGPTIIAGDFNIAPADEDVYDPAAFVGSTHVTPEERTQLQAILDLGMRDAWHCATERGEHTFTWWDYRAGAFHRNLGMRIDLALVSEDLADRVTWCGIDRDFRKGAKPSDHAPLMVRLSD